MTTGSEVCDAVQLAIVSGRPLDDAHRRHRDACAECRIIVDASGELLLGRYRIEALCGRGARGLVYRAADLETGDRIALKLVRMAGEGSLEIRNARKIRHRNVCSVYHVEHHGALRLISMEWIDGPTLAQRMVGSGDALEVIRGICAGVAAAHAEGVLHLDLKPSNVLFRGNEPVITDFGLSGREPAGGGARYMAPEQLEGGVVDCRTDVYALGRLAESLIARPPRRLRRAIRRATSANPARRYADAEGFALALAPSTRRRWMALSLAAVAATAAALLAIPPPHGPRAAWDASRWGPDVIPMQAWNVARNPIGEGLPRIEVEDPIWGCGQRPYDAIDGVAEYESWEHGVAFQPAPSAEHPDYACVSLHLMDVCGTLHDDDPLCEFNDTSSQADYHVIPAHGRDVVAMSPARRARIGLAVATRPCGERALRLRLDATYPVFALRVWHRGAQHTPQSFRIELRDEHGDTHVVAITHNRQGRHVRDHQGTANHAFGAPSAPVTTEFAPVTTREIRYVIDTCSTALVYTDDTLMPVKVLPGHGWIYEIEAFAMLPRWEAWRRYLGGPVISP